MRKIILLLIVSVFFLAPDASAKGVETTFDVGGGVWFLEMDGSVQVTDIGLNGTDIDLASDLDIDDTKTIPEIKVECRFYDKHRVSISYFGADFGGTKTLTQNINFNGATYAINSVVTSELDISIVEPRYSYSFIKDANKELAGFFGVKFASIDASLSAAGVGERTEDFDGPIPVIGIEGEVKLNKNYSLGGEFGGISMDVGDVDFTLIDFIAKLNYDFNESWRASFAYRYLDAEGDSDDDEADFSLTGPIISVIGSW